MNMFKLSIAAACITLAGCSETLGGLAIIGTAVTGFMQSGSANPDYTKYADTCKMIVGDILAIKVARYEAIQAGVNSKDPYVKGGAMVMLALEGKDDGPLMSRCQLQGPESFLQTLLRNTNVANLMLALYQENRADSRSQRQMQLQKELGLAGMRHDETMQSMENDLLKGLANNTVEGFKAGAEAAKQPAVSSTPAE